MGPQRILGAHGRRAWGLNGSWGHSGGAHGAVTDPGGTWKAHMGPQQILGAHGRRRNESRGHVEVGVHEAFTVWSMVTERTEERAGDQRYSLPKGLLPNMG